MKNHIQVGDTVVYTRKFLKSIGVPATDIMWRWQATVTGLLSLGSLVLAEMSHGLDPDPEADKAAERERGYPWRVNVANLARKGTARANVD